MRLTIVDFDRFHQMHCLAKMRMVMQQSREGVKIGEDWMDDSHWPHCFDYLRSVSLIPPRMRIGTSLLRCVSQ